MWKADTGYGSAFQGVVADSQLYWGAGDRLVFPWEKDGWLHLYSVPAAGGKATLLTPGNFEVEYVNISPDRSRDDLQLEPGRHRPAARLDGARSMVRRSPPEMLTKVNRQRMAAGRDRQRSATLRRCTPTRRCRRT